MKKYLLIGAIAVLAVGVAVYFVYNKPHRDVASEEASYTLTADQLFDEYEADEAAANAKFLDKTVQVSGVVAEVGTDDGGKPFVILSAENAMMGGVSATFQGEQTGLSEGQEVSVKCRCTGKLMDVVLINCSLSN